MHQKIKANVYRLMPHLHYYISYISSNLLYIRLILLLKSEVARMAVFFAIDYALCATFSTGLLVIYSRI